MTELTTLISDLVAINSVNPDLVPGAAGEGALADFIAAWGQTPDWKSSSRKPGRDVPMSCL